LHKNAGLFNISQAALASQNAAANAEIRCAAAEIAHTRIVMQHLPNAAKNRNR
jgi:hypothetical protein